MGNLYEVNIATGDITTDGTLTAAGVLTTSSGISPIGSSSFPYGLAHISPVLPNYESVSGTNQRGLTAIDDSHRVLTNDGTNWGLDSFIRRIIKENANGGTRVLTAKDAGVMRIVDCTNFNQIYTLPVSSSLGSNGAFFGFCKQDPTSNSIELSFASALDSVGGFTKRYLKLDGDHIILGSSGGEYFIVSNGNSLPDQLFRPHRTPVFSEGQFPYNVNVSSDRGAIIRCVVDTGAGTVNLPSAADFDSIKTSESPPYVNTYTLCIQRTNSSNYPVHIVPAAGTSLNGSSDPVTLTRDWESIIIDWDSAEWTIIGYTRGGALNDTASVFGSGFNTSSSGTLGEITISGGLGSLAVEGAVPYRKGSSTGSESNFTYDEVTNALIVDNAVMAGSLTVGFINSGTTSGTIGSFSSTVGANTMTASTISGSKVQVGDGNLEILSGVIDLSHAGQPASMNNVQHIGKATFGSTFINTVSGGQVQLKVGGITYFSVGTLTPVIVAGGIAAAATVTGTQINLGNQISAQSGFFANNVQGAAAPVSGTHLTNKAYVDGQSFAKAVVAGSNITVTSGTSTITIDSSAGGAGFLHTQSTPATTWNANHLLNTRTPQVIVYDTAFNVIVPDTEVATDLNNYTITFSSSIAGYAQFLSGGASVVTSGVTDHGALTGLADDDHTQYILAAGTRAFSGNQSFGGNNITSVGTITATVVSGTTIQAGSGNLAILSGYLDLVNATTGAGTVQHVGRASNGAVVINTIAGTDLRFRVGGTTFASVAATAPTITAGGFFGCATVTGTTGQFGGTLSSQTLVTNSGIFGLPPNFNIGTTGGGAALLGTNSPATSLAEPATWIEIKLPDGRKGWFPVWV